MHDDDDPLWQDIVHQVEDALREADLDDDSTRDAVLAGVREAMSALQPPKPPKPPHISVLPGGRGADAPPPERPKVRVSTEVLRPARPRVVSRGAGQIRLGADGGMQTILQAPGPRAYRLWCAAGALRVMADGQPVARLLPGQSLDVEAGLIQVSADEAASGGYRRLPAG